MMKKPKEKAKAGHPSVADSFKGLEEILAWFESRDDVDLEEGLEKIKEGARLVKLSRERLKKVENEFKAVRELIGEES